MQNIHLNYSERFNFPEAYPGVVVHSYLDGELYCSNGSVALCFNKENGVKSTDLGSPISYMCFSDYHGAPVAIAEDGIYQLEEENTKLFNTGEDEDGKIIYGQLYDGGASAIIVREAGVFLISFENSNKKFVSGIEGNVKAVSVREDGKFIAIATENTLYTVKVEEGEIHGKTSLEGVANLSWSPRLTWLAASAGKKLNFYEKNTEFRTSLDFETQIASVHYSSDWDVIATISAETGDITVLSTKNRVWSKKFVLPSKPGTTIFWNSTETFELIAADEEGFMIYHFDMTTDSDGNNMYVVDGNVLKTSHWDRSLIPPPLAHEKKEFDSQIECIACDENHLAVFTTNKLNIPANDVSIETPGLVHCAAFRGDELFFAVESKLYKYNGEITEVADGNEFINFITPNFTVYNGCKITNLEGEVVITTPEKIDSFTDNEGVPVYKLASKTLVEGTKEVCKNVYSYLSTGKLLTYVYNEKHIVIKFGENQTEHLVEEKAVVLFFVKKLFSIIIQMQRGNTETQAPHVIVEAHMADLLKEKNYTEALFISKRYQIPFNRIIRLGEISIPDLLEQIQDSKLRPFISVLTPLYKEESTKNKATRTPEETRLKEEEKKKQLPECEIDKKFIIQLLTYIFDTESVFENGKVQFPKESGKNDVSNKFFSVVCICFILLDNPVAAIEFSCSIKDASVSQASLEFLLTLFDAERLFDLSMKTYDLRCIRTVGHVTMKEPLSYIPMLEDFAKKDRNVMIAEIDETVDDYSEAIKHYAACGPDFFNKCKNIAIREKLYDDAIKYLPRDTEQYKEVFLAKVEALNKAKKYEELARMVAVSHDEQTILKYLDKIVISGLHELIIRDLSEGNYEELYKKLISTGRYDKAASFALHNLHQPEKAAEAFMMCHQWGNAVQCGKDVNEVAEVSFNYYYKKATNDKKEVESLKKKFENIKEKQKQHAESNKRSGKKRDERGLPAIIEKLNALVPTKEEVEQFKQADAILMQCNREDDRQMMYDAFIALTRALEPLPSLPENENKLPPNHLRKFLGYN